METAGNTVVRIEVATVGAGENLLPFGTFAHAEFGQEFTFVLAIVTIAVSVGIGDHVSCESRSNLDSRVLKVNFEDTHFARHVRAGIMMVSGAAMKLPALHLFPVVITVLGHVDAVILDVVCTFAIHHGILDGIRGTAHISIAGVGCDVFFNTVV